MQMLSYISESLITENGNRAEISRLLKNARLRNAKLDLTGVLFLNNDLFFQTIEGPRDAVHEVFQSIKADTRHTGVYLIIDEPITERRFADWTMEGFHNPKSDLEFLEVLHGLGQCFYSDRGFCASAMATYVSALVSEMIEHRVILPKAFAPGNLRLI